MGQKVNPIGLRLGVNKNWDSIWFDEKNYANKLHEDIIIRNYINNKLSRASVSNIQIERTPKKVNVTINTARPGIVIGKGGGMIKEIQRLSRNKMGKSFEKFVDLRLFVKVMSDWQNKIGLLKEMNLNDK